MDIIYKKAQEFIYRNARPLDLARWQFHFENGSKKVVLKALSYYQNPDGGFGHALEQDAWNPNSAPIQTWTATEILHEINFSDSSDSIINGILRYLGSGRDFNGKFWYNIIKSNNDYPHAPWWQSDSESSSHNDYNPTAGLAGFIIRYSDKNSELYKLGCRISQEAYEQLVSADNHKDMHTILCYIRLMEYIKAAGATDVIDLNTLQSILIEHVKGCITQNTEAWGTSYICKPSQFFNSMASIFYASNKEIAEYECEYIMKTQLEDGSWDIPWSWNDYPEAWAISKNWWKSNGIIINMLYTRGFSVRS